MLPFKKGQGQSPSDEKIITEPVPKSTAFFMWIFHKKIAWRRAGSVL